MHHTWSSPEHEHCSDDTETRKNFAAPGPLLNSDSEKKG